MAGIREIALGIATMLQTTSRPEPLPIDLWNEKPQDTSVLIRAIIDECADAGAPLARIVVDPVLAAALGNTPENGQVLSYRGVTVSVALSLSARFELHRRA